MLNLKEINYNKDVPEVVALLRSSLSENHTIGNFLWKHTESPFGESYGLLARDKDEIVGVRMFMFWEFIKGNNLIKALRPVDTVTHPNYRGQGIFKKLNLAGVENCQGKFDLIFNTPNDNSIKGNLKLGWNKFPKKLDYKISIFSPQKVTSKIISVKEIDDEVLSLDSNFYKTNHSKDYLRWRYQDSTYKAIKLEVNTHKLYVIFRIQKIKGITLIVLNEVFGDPQYHTAAVRTLCYRFKTIFVHHLNTQFVSISSLMSLSRNNSEVLYRDDKKSIIKRVLFSSGDLEGKI
ncbi:MAG: GNAT family N-acetyltransferase [Salegentibacter mishustinae]|nr:GNAT family N-acetyltransferase [Salegentibacter mishustinae]